MGRRRYLVLLAAALCALAAPAAPSEGTSTCRTPRGYTVVERSREAVIWVRKDWERSYGCLHRTNRRVLLAPSGWHTLAGRFVAYDASFYAGEGDERYLVFVVDLLRDTDRTGPLFADPDFGRPEEGEGPRAQLTGLTLKRNGSAAWISCALEAGTDIDCERRGAYQVWRLDRRGTRMLEESVEVEPGSLRRVESTISWRSGGQVREASLK